MSLTTILAATLGVNFIIVFIGVIAYLHEKKSATNILFLAISLLTAVWSFMNYFSIQASPQNVLLWIRLVLFFAAPHSVVFFLFIHTFPSNKIHIRKTFLAGILAVLVVAMWATLSPYVFTNVQIRGDQVIPTPGILMPLFALVAIGSLVTGIVLAIQKYFKSGRFDRVRWRFMLFGIITSYLSLIVTNFLIVVVWKNTTFNALGALYMLPMIVGAGYAIIQHHLLNIKVIATEILIFLIALIAFVNIWGYQDISDLIFRVIIFFGLFIGGIFLVQSVLREVEQRERLEMLTQQLETANVELKKLDKAKSEFLSIASHQLRSPLTAVKGYVSLVLEGSYGKLTKKMQRPLKNVYESNERLVDLVNDLLNITRIESGRVEMDWKKIDLPEMIASVVEELKVKAQEKGIELQFTIPSNPLPEVMADEEKIRNVILNLIDNAIHYTEKGSITTNVKVQESAATGKSVIVSVKDTGAGMNKEEIGNLFQSFTRGSARAQWTGGSGLGLYIAKQFTQLHGGRIWAESEGKGKGSTFLVEIPLLKEIPPDKKPLAAPDKF